MGKFNEYSQKATPANNDTLMIYDATAKVNKLSPFSGVWNWIVDRLANVVVSKLTTSDKTMIGAINEIDGRKYRATVKGTIDIDDYTASDSKKLPGVYYLNGASIPAISTSTVYGALILLAPTDIQILIVQNGNVYIRNRTGNPLEWKGWKKCAFAVVE